MAIGLWKKTRIIRRFGDTSNNGGLPSTPYSDIEMKLDVQTTDRSTATSEDGDDTYAKLRTFGSSELVVADPENGKMGDRLWYRGKWFECRSSQLRENTFLRHWDSTFVECADQMDAPAGAAEGGSCGC